jgi:hypothetical protein
MIVVPVGLSLQCALTALPAVVYILWNQINVMESHTTMNKLNYY